MRNLVSLNSKLTAGKIYLSAFTAFSILITIVIFGYNSIQTSRQSAVWVAHTLEVISDIQNIKTFINEAGAIQRGYIITQQEKYHEMYKKTLPEGDKHLRTLNSIIQDNPEQAENAIKIQMDIADLLTYFSTNIQYVKDGQTDKAVVFVKSGKSQEIFEKISKRLEDMESIERQLLNERLKFRQQSVQKAISIILFGVGLAVTLMIFGTIVIVIEFKRRKLVQEDLNHTTEIQKAILDSAAFAIITGDLDGRITMFNPAAEALLGYKQEELLGKSPALFHKPDEVAKKARELSQRFQEVIPVGYETFTCRARKGLIENDNWTYVRKDGKEIPVNLTVTPQKSISGQISGFVGIAYDISQQKEYEEGIITAKEQALEGTKAKSEFLANMSHEIRTPMNAIMGMAELLSETKLDLEQKKYVDIFKRAGDSLLNLINDILDLSKIEAGHFELDRMPFHIYNVVEKAAEIMALKAHQKHVELAVDLQEDLHEHYIGDPNRIRQIILNLLGNAVKFTRRGEVLLKIYAGKNFSKNQSELIIEVQDTGIGMSEEQLKKLFQRFRQADNSITKEFGGTGLGLNITKRLTELMNGTIEVSSSFGIGTKFVVKIQLEKDDVPQDTYNVKLSGKRILVVDDTKTNRFILKKILEHQKAIVDEAFDGETALTRITEMKDAQKPYDLILLDCRMPGIDGFTVAEKIQNDDSLKGPLLMMLTSDNRPGDLAKSKSLGLDSYLVKPVLKNDLLNEIQKSFNGQHDRPVITESLHPVSAHQSLSILLVDDNEENRLVIKSFLKSLPWKITEAKNGNEAILNYQQEDFDIILMDMQMPIVDGYTATREIRKIEKESQQLPTPIYALTAYALKEEIDKSLEAGCNGHLTKPIAKAKLVETIQNVTASMTITVDKDLEDLIPDYLSNRQKELEELNEAFDQKNFSKIQSIGHRLRGSAGSYGFAALSEIGKELEEKSKVMDEITIRHTLNDYQLYLHRIKITYK